MAICRKVFLESDISPCLSSYASSGFSLVSRVIVSSLIAIGVI
jgi:hypothetical protein